MLPQTSKRSAVQVAKRLHKLLREHTYMEDEGLKIKLTASFGLASFPTDATNRADLIHMADASMYDVKKSTRNSISVANQGMLV
jgi:diguanylate cyclase (GGDEF)-like protein